MGCDRPLNFRPTYDLCPPCLEVLEPNMGPRCQRCDEPLNAPNLRGSCTRCQLLPPPFVTLRAPFLYGGPLAPALSVFKFFGRLDVGESLGVLLAQHLPRIDDVSAIAPIPLSWRRRIRRGYNQSAVLGMALSRAWGVPWAMALERVRHRPPQSSLDVEARQRNARGVFRARGGLSGRFVLVDDVVTSAATVREASRALLQAGAREVYVVALLRRALV